MKEKFRNIFWFFGIFAIVVMLCTFDMDYQELWQNCISNTAGDFALDEESGEVELVCGCSSIT